MHTQQNIPRNEPGYTARGCRIHQVNPPYASKALQNLLAQLRRMVSKHKRNAQFPRRIVKQWRDRAGTAYASMNNGQVIRMDLKPGQRVPIPLQ